MIRTSDIDFQKITPAQFEELGFKLIRRLSFQKVRWRQGAGDNGRDIQAIKFENNELTGTYEEKWFFECKHYKNGVPPVEFESKFAWATAEKAKNLVFILSSHISNNGDGWLDKRKAGVEYNVHLIEGNELKEVLLDHIDLVKEFGLIESNLKLISLIYDKWIINDAIPSWHTVITTLNETNLEHLSLNEVLLLISLMEIHEKLNSEKNQLGGEDEQLFMDSQHKIIEFGNNLYFKNTQNEVAFEKSTWDKIEWCQDINYGEINDEPIEDSFAHSSVNKVKFEGVIGFFTVLTEFNDEGYQIVKPVFIAQDSTLSLIKFETLNPQDTNDFKKDYIDYRPTETEKDTFNNFFGWDIIEDDDLQGELKE
ncbi:restriction endonuclease [Marinilabilia salmonicolor]|uniref:Restriction endonuclease n=1 Tax=Marinilabilia salmonicolor TaxID=989 RepID=A0A368ULN0_9BACT|nr:restriction endonuclease [Marinilabilia salmonicolor]RCW29652.1 restriction endonuclease [Marinilabilia salmonicolor]